MYLNITDETAVEIRDIYLQKIRMMFQEAIKTSEKNSVALLNKLLFEWQIGQLRDEEFLEAVQKDLHDQEPEMAHLMFLLFKRNVLCYAVMKEEYKAALAPVETDCCIVSNITKYLYDNQQFKDHRRSKNQSDFKFSFIRNLQNLQKQDFLVNQSV